MHDIYLVLGLSAFVVVLLIMDSYDKDCVDKQNEDKFQEQSQETEGFRVTVNNHNGRGYGRYGRYGSYGGRYRYGPFPYGYDYVDDDYPYYSPYYSSWYSWFNPYAWWY